MRGFLVLTGIAIVAAFGSVQKVSKAVKDGKKSSKSMAIELGIEVDDGTYDEAIELGTEGGFSFFNPFSFSTKKKNPNTMVAPRDSVLSSAGGTYNCPALNNNVAFTGAQTEEGYCYEYCNNYGGTCAGACGLRRRLAADNQKTLDGGFLQTTA